MKVGDYVRFKTLSREIKIGRVIEIIAPDKNSMKKYCVYDLDNNEVTVDDYIIKSSPFIIDLIEAEDYVNGYKVGCIDDCKGAMRQFYYDDENPNDDVGHWEEEIKTIVKKEAFESMEYKL